MTDDIIDLTAYLQRDEGADFPRGAMALWGAEGERSRFALPLWRIIYLARAERGVIVWRATGGDGTAVPFVALDLAREPARVEITTPLPPFAEDEEPGLLDRGRDGLVVFLGMKAGRAWSLLVDGGNERTAPLAPNVREDILFLAGECAGLLFLRDLAIDGAASDGADPGP